MEVVSPLSTRRRIPASRLGMFMTGLIVLVAAIGFGRTQSFEWFVLKNAIRAKYPGIRRISTAELAAWLDDRSRTPPVLLDTRTEAEWNVSHITGARRVDPGASADVAGAGIARDAPIVTYCSVGYRSSEIARRLRAAGYQDVQNLEGSIFQWANEGRPLVRPDGGRTSKVHPYNSWWGRLLNDESRAEISATR